jgi:hypothetical protein
MLPNNFFDGQQSSFVVANNGMMSAANILPPPSSIVQQQANVAYGMNSSRPQQNIQQQEREIAEFLARSSQCREQILINEQSPSQQLMSAVQQAPPLSIDQRLVRQLLGATSLSQVSPPVIAGIQRLLPPSPNISYLQQLQVILKKYPNSSLRQSTTVEYNVQALEQLQLTAASRFQPIQQAILAAQQQQLQQNNSSLAPQQDAQPFHSTAGVLPGSSSIQQHLSQQLINLILAKQQQQIQHQQQHNRASTLISEALMNIGATLPIENPQQEQPKTSSCFVSLQNSAFEAVPQRQPNLNWQQHPTSETKEFNVLPANSTGIIPQQRTLTQPYEFIKLCQKSE